MTYEELIVKKGGVTPQIIPSAEDKIGRAHV